MRKQKTPQPGETEGTPAFRKLLQVSGAKREFAAAQSRFRTAITEITPKIEANADARAGLDKLAGAGCDRNVVLRGVALQLALQLESKRPRHWQAKARLTKRGLVSLAQRLRIIATEVERAYAAIESHPDIWRVALQLQPDDPATPASHRVPEEWLAKTQRVTEELRQMSRGLGKMGKSQPPRSRRGALPLLAGYIAHQVRPPAATTLPEVISAAMTHLQVLCEEILEPVYQACGLNPDAAPSADSLRHHIRRRQT